MTASASFPASPTARSDWRHWLLAGALMMWLGVHLSASGLNADWMRWLHQGAAPAWPALWAGLSVLGLGWGGAIVVCALARPGQGRPVAALLLLLPLAGVAIQLAKRGLAVQRPAAVLGHELQVVGERLIGSSSMPSGHSLTAAAVFTLLMLGTRLAWHWRLLAAALAAGVLWSRVQVGAHWPADVLVGGGLGVWLAVAAWHLSGDVPRLVTWGHRLGEARAQRVLALGELGLALGLLLTPTGFEQAWPVQWGLAGLAVASAAWRWRVVTGRAA
jgi:membrane-associated phospholipid phosphatase